MSNIALTVGRMVYYKTRGSADSAYPSMDSAAIITRVISDTVINLVSLATQAAAMNYMLSRGK